MRLIVKRQHMSEQNFRFLILLFTLVAMLLIPTYVEDARILGHLWTLCATGVMVAALYSLAGGGLMSLFWMCLLLIPSIVTNWLNLYLDYNWVVFADNLTTIMYFSLVGWFLIRFIMGASMVNSNVIYAALCLYMILAFIWAAIYHLHYVYFDESFLFSNDLLAKMAENSETTFSMFNYYSFVTLTTLGYGDIVPVTRSAQAWVAVEAMVGQFYIAIVIARLVSAHQPAGNTANQSADSVTTGVD